MIKYTQKDIDRLRDLGRKAAAIAALPDQAHRKQLWTAVNDLHPIRPVLYTRDTPVFVLNYNDELTPVIEDPFLRSLEMTLLIRLYEWNHIRVDKHVPDYIYCNCVIEDSGFGLETTSKGNATDNAMKSDRQEAFHYEVEIETEDDIEKIKNHEVVYNEETTMKRYNLMKEIFDGILEVKLYGKNYFRVAPWDDILTWMGMGDAMLNFYEDPDLMHGCMRRYIDSCIDWVKKYEALGLLSSNNCGDFILNNGPGFTEDLPEPPESGIGAKLKDIWGAASDQIMTSVSPAMTREYAYEYESEFAELFGLMGIGCCEALDQKVPDIFDCIGNVRQITVSPFTKLEPTLEKIGNKAVACFKPNSNFLILDDWNEAKELLTKELDNVLNLAEKYNNNLTINMKTIIHLCGEPQRLWWWCDMASKMVADRYGY